MSELHADNLLIVNATNAVGISIHLPPGLFIEGICEHIDNLNGHVV